MGWRTGRSTPPWIGPLGASSYTWAVVQHRNGGSAVEAVIDEDGNGVIPAEQLPSRLPAGTHLRVYVEPFGTGGRSVEGLLPRLPEVTWEQFEEASRVASEEAEAGHHRW